MSTVGLPEASGVTRRRRATSVASKLARPDESMRFTCRSVG